MAKDIVGTARVRVTVEVATSSWNPNCTVEQIMRQASEEAVNKVRGMVAQGGGTVVGEPDVIATIGARG